MSDRDLELIQLRGENLFLRRRIEELTRQDESLLNRVLEVKTAEPNDEVVDEVLQQSEKQIKNLEHEKAVLQDRVWQLERIERNRDRGGGGYSDEVRRLQLEVGRIREDRGRMQKENDWIRQEKRRIELTLEQVEREKQDLRERQPLALRDLQEKLYKANKDIDLHVKDKRTLSDDLKRERDSSQRRFQQLQEELDRRRNEIDLLNAKLFEERQHKHLNDPILKTKYDEANDQILELKATIGRLNDELLVAKNGWDQGERDEILTLKRHLQLEKETLNKSLQKVEELSQKINELTRQKKEVEKHLTSTVLQSPRAGVVQDELVSDLRAQIRQLEDDKLQLQGQGSTHTQIESLQKEITSLQREVTNLRQDCEQYRQERDGLIEQLKERPRGARSGIDTTQRTYEEAHRQLKKDYEKLELKAMVLNQQIATLEQENAELTTTNNQLRKRMNNQQRDFQKERGQSSDKINELVLVNNELRKNVTYWESQVRGLSPSDGTPMRDGHYSDQLDRQQPIPVPRKKRSNSAHHPRQVHFTPQLEDIQAKRDEVSDHRARLNQLRASNRQKELQLAVGTRGVQQYDDYTYDDVIQERSMEDNTSYQ